MRTLAVASGKGGVGKTIITANLGAALAANGQRVVLFDADLGLANLDVVLGVKSDVTVRHLVEGLAGAETVAVEGPAGLRVIVGNSGVGSLLRLSRSRLEVVLEKTRDLDDSTDFLILDVASGADARVITFLAFADEAILVTTPDPASIVDCYSTAKVLLRRKKDADISILVNRVRRPDEGRRVFEALNSAMSRFLHRQACCLGYVEDDQAAADISRTCRPFVLADSRLPASTDIATIAALLAQTRSGARLADVIARRVDARGSGIHTLAA